MEIKISDQIALFLEEKKIKTVFGIIGAGNAHLFDSITKRGYTEIVCVHHEQAAVMAMQTYFRMTGQLTVVLLTTGAGSTNGVTGVVSAWMDSMPGIIIAGNEHSKYTKPENDLRIWGVQGYDSVDMVKKVTVYSNRVMDPLAVNYELEKAYSKAITGRPGPVWLEIPMDIQSTKIDPINSKVYTPEKIELKAPSRCITNAPEAVEKVMAKLKDAKRPLLWLGHGIRLAEATELLEPLLKKFKIPALVSWAGIDMIDSDHPLVCGRAGVYGQRAANFILQNCDFLLTIGTRLAIPQVGYDLSEFARGAGLAVVDIELKEVMKLGERVDFPICLNAKDFLTEMLKHEMQNTDAQNEWIERCNQYKRDYPWIGPEHKDKPGYINSYPFMEKLVRYFKPNQVVVTDMGTALLSGHQVLKFKKGQRFMTSTGLGEMGYGLPAALGASFATDRGEVMCLNCDGGMMMNLQELQTVVHHQLPIKLFIFNNDGYLMIKHTQKAMFEGRYAGTDRKSGVSCPDYSKIATAFGMPSYQIRTWSDFETIIPKIQSEKGPVICEVFMDPEQLFVPKLSLVVKNDGTLVSPPLEDLSPLLSREEMRKNMLNGLHPKSEKL